MIVRRASRASVVLIAAATAVMLTSCVSTQIPQEAPNTSSGSSATPESTPSAPSTPSGGGGGSQGGAADYAFDGEPFVTADTYAQWTDTMLASTDFEVESSDNGAGMWSYRHVETTCVVGFWQGSMDGYDGSEGEKALTDELLVWGIGADDFATIEPYVEGGVAPFYSAVGDDTIETRALVRQADSGERIVMSARGFAENLSGLIAYITCPADVDPLSLWAEFADQYGAFRVISSPIL